MEGLISSTQMEKPHIQSTQKYKDGLYQGEDIDDIQMIDNILKLNL